MALVGQVATVAQLVGVDAYGLITMIAEAARTVRRNRATCLQLARRVEMIGGLLRQLQATQLMHQPETRDPVEELEETLRRAYLLVRSCQRRGYVYRCFMGTRHADELREVQGEIAFYLQLFPLVSYVDATLTWARLLSKAHHPCCQQAPMVRPYFVPSLFLSCDGCCLAIVQGVCLGIVYTRFTPPLVLSTDVCICEFFMCHCRSRNTLLTCSFLILSLNTLTMI
ncbi:cell number regulator 13-like [Phragmites australis]|uniref:cell number regulator 13-like n=1 Tax=Phragmites australis TaxID=29695 RepID=UPI002D78C3B0|nr:cell number regulator 13-like [Phragmites australis]